MKITKGDGKRRFLRASLATVAALILGLLAAGAAFAAPGELDPTFGGDGKTTTDFGSLDAARALVALPGGDVAAAGGSDFDFALARYNPDGSLDAGFGGDGKVTTDFFGDLDEAFALVALPSGDLVATGYATDPDTFATDFALARYGSNGLPDAGFGGCTISDTSGDNDVAAADSKDKVKNCEKVRRR